MSQFQFGVTISRKKWVNARLVIRKNENLVSQITIAAFAQIFVGVETNSGFRNLSSPYLG